MPRLQISYHVQGQGPWHGGKKGFTAIGDDKGKAFGDERTPSQSRQRSLFELSLLKRE